MVGITDQRCPRFRLRILLADDSLLQQKHAVALLRKHGHSVTVTNNGHEAVQTLEGQDFDVVLMDVEMPVMDGLEATAIIRERESRMGGHVPVFAVTAISDHERCLAAGMDAYLAKPLSVDVFHQTVQGFLGIC
jgi:two-component system, sensor histidine kinase and response regulator